MRSYPGSRIRWRLTVKERPLVNGRTVFRRFPEMKTERLFLRRPSLNDVARYYEYFSEPEMIWTSANSVTPKGLVRVIFVLSWWSGMRVC